ncbi:hypothetical protein [Spirosoma spitsbergense]|uniref:hypothetical protein n=1 Tax=Spirosoma spitsbergense TaxID=431554 RepID=UPI0003740EFB|nr:hypothetical protein [Spirosoma spitsbergense]
MKTDLFVQQLDVLLTAYADIKIKGYKKGTSEHEQQVLLSRAIAAVHRLSGHSSSYSAEVNRVLEEWSSSDHFDLVFGIVKALREDLSAGYLQSLTEIVHAEVFADFIEMAFHLLSNGYKDAAAVIVGSTLESHLRKLAVKNSIPIETDDKPLKAERINQELAKATIYTILDQKNVTAWLDLRNKAAHGNYSDYMTDQVKLLIAGIQDFITRNPA